MLQPPSMVGLMVMLLIWVSGGIMVIVAKVYLGFSESTQENIWIVPHIRPIALPSIFFQFFIHSHLPFYTIYSELLTVWGHPTSLSAALFRVQLGTHTSLIRRPFLGLCTTPSRIQADQSQDTLFWPITGQFILANHRQHTNKADQIKRDGLDQ